LIAQGFKIGIQRTGKELLPADAELVRRRAERGVTVRFDPERKLSPIDRRTKWLGHIGCATGQYALTGLPDRYAVKRYWRKNHDALSLKPRFTAMMCCRGVGFTFSGQQTFGHRASVQCGG
jgi:hypothetical protein